MASPQICGPDAEVWLTMIKRDVPNWDKVPHEPKNPQSWYKVYRKLLADSKKEIAKDAELLKATMDGIKAKQQERTAKKVELSVVKVPQGMKPNGETIKLPGDSGFFNEKKSALRARRQDQSQMVRAPGSLAPHQVRSKLEQFRKEARARNHFPTKQIGIVSTSRTKPVRVTTPPGTVAAPPANMVREYRTAATAPPPIDPTAKPAETFNPRKRRIEHDDAPQSSDPKRLRPSKSTIEPQPTTTTSSPVRPPSSMSTTIGSSISRGQTASPLGRLLKPLGPMRLKKAPASPFMAHKRRVK